MRHKNLFSIIELMTVTFIILLLMSLMIPVFVNLKMNARTALCKNNMRQIGTLITSYQTDNSGYLPNDDEEDIPKPAIGDRSFYRHWQGHLLPYLDFNLPEKYTQGAIGQIVGGEFKVLPAPIPASNVLKGGWVVINSAFKEGGFQDLKAFICPEIHGNTIDVGVLETTGALVPRIGVMYYNYAMKGIPTTYLANELFFGRNQTWSGPKMSYRADQITEISQKALIIEGGLAVAGLNGEVSPPYYMLNNYGAYTGGALVPRFKKSLASIHKLSFVHDAYDTFWIKNDFGAAAYGARFDLVEKFNTQFAGKAMMISGAGLSDGSSNDYSLVSYVNPDNGKIFDAFFKANSTLSPLGSWDQFVDDQNDYKYLVGNMNVLLGDGSVSTKNNSWICNNRQKIANAPY